MLKRFLFTTGAVALIALLAACYLDDSVAYYTPEEFIVADDEEPLAEEFIIAEVIYEPAFMEVFFVMEEILQSGERDEDRIFDMLEERFGEQRIQQFEDDIDHWFGNLEMSDRDALERLAELFEEHELTTLLEWYAELFDVQIKTAIEGIEPLTEEFITAETIYEPEFMGIFYLWEEILQSGEQNFELAWEMVEEQIGEHRMNQLLDAYDLWFESLNLGSADSYIIADRLLLELLESHELTMLYDFCAEQIFGTHAMLDGVPYRIKILVDILNTINRTPFRFQMEIYPTPEDYSIRTIEAASKLFDDTGKIALIIPGLPELSVTFETRENAIEMLEFIYYDEASDYWLIDYEAFVR